MFPLTSGNSFLVNQYLKSVADTDLMFFQNYLFERNYFTNLYKIDGDDELNEIWPELMATRFDLGVCAIKKIGDYFCVLGLGNIQKRLNGTIKSATGNVFLQQSTQQTPEIQIPLTDDNCIFIKLNQLMLPSLLFLWTFLKNKQKYLEAFETNMFTSTIKGIIFAENPEDQTVLDEAMSTIMNPKKALIVAPRMYSADTTSTNKKGSAKKSKMFELQELDLGSKANESVTANIDWYLRYNYHLLGREYNTEAVKDHVNPNTTDMTQSNFQILHNESKKYLEQFILEWNKKYSRNAKLVDVSVKDEPQGEIKDDNKSNVKSNI